MIYLSFYRFENYQLELGSDEEPTIHLISERKVSNCQRLGPFEDIDFAEGIADQIVSAGYQVKLRALDEDAKAFDYRVLTPATTSVQDAYRLLRELKSKNIDSFVITIGEGSLAISLGVFSSLEAAVDRHLNLIEEGYDLQIKETPRFIRRYWVLADNGIDFSSQKTKVVDTSNMVAEWTEAVCLN